MKALALAALLYISASPWQTLREPPRQTLGIWYWANIAFGVLFAIGYVWILLRHRYFRVVSAGVIALFVVGQAVYVEGLFAQTYYALSAQMPHSFDPPRLTGIDATYFTISTDISRSARPRRPAWATFAPSAALRA